MGYNSTCERDICEIIASIERFSGMGHLEWCRANFPWATLVAMATYKQTFHTLY